MNANPLQPKEAISKYVGYLDKLNLTHGSAYVAVAYWCDATWPICSGSNRAAVEKAADVYLGMWPSEYNSEGNLVNGHGAEGYWIMKVPSLCEVAEAGVCASCAHWRPEPRHKLWGRCGRVDHAMQYGALTEYPYDQKADLLRVRLSEVDNRGKISTYRDFGCNRFSAKNAKDVAGDGEAKTGLTKQMVMV